MVNEEIRDDLAAAERTFEDSPVTIEEGLNVDDPEWSNFVGPADFSQRDSICLSEGTTPL